MGRAPSRVIRFDSPAVLESGSGLLEKKELLLLLAAAPACALQRVTAVSSISRQQVCFYVEARYMLERVHARLPWKTGALSHRTVS